jgi:hypothetical protein
LPIVRTVLDRPTAYFDGHRCAETADERELALLAQFMRHDSVASLANALAERSGGSLRARDLIASAGLGPSRPTADVPPVEVQPLVNPGAGFCG